MKKQPAVDTDFFFTRMKQEVHKFYNQYYFGVDRKWKKYYHVRLMSEYYEPSLFNCCTSTQQMRARKEEFLSMIQVLVDSRTE